ncbi:MAG: DUF2007 domain-containing protein [Lentimicrobiaceae bacterium]|jgi:hypothetical protein|nr:DUF2007 domain-containing protein [Lentimicrobiaceae bacterium]
MTNEKLTPVYTGSIVEANFLVELLQENGIDSILRDSLNESIIAGWASGSPEFSVRIFVEEEDSANAKKVLETYFKTRE